MNAWQQCESHLWQPSWTVSIFHRAALRHMQVSDVIHVQMQVIPKLSNPTRSIEKMSPRGEKLSELLLTSAMRAWRAGCYLNFTVDSGFLSYSTSPIPASMQPFISLFHVNPTWESCKFHKHGQVMPVSLLSLGFNEFSRLSDLLWGEGEGLWERPSTPMQTCNTRYSNTLRRARLRLWMLKIGFLHANPLSILLWSDVMGAKPVPKQTLCGTYGVRFACILSALSSLAFIPLSGCTSPFRWSSVLMKCIVGPEGFLHYCPLLHKRTIVGTYNNTIS